MPREAVLKRFELQLNDRNVIFHDIKVVKDAVRHMLHLEGNPFRVTLIRDGDRRITAVSDDLDLLSLVKDLPEFMIRLLS